MLSISTPSCSHVHESVEWKNSAVHTKICNILLNYNNNPHLPGHFKTISTWDTLEIAVTLLLFWLLLTPMLIICFLPIFVLKSRIFLFFRDSWQWFWRTEIVPLIVFTCSSWTLMLCVLRLNLNSALDQYFSLCEYNSHSQTSLNMELTWNSNLDMFFCCCCSVASPAWLSTSSLDFCISDWLLEQKELNSSQTMAFGQKWATCRL